MRVLLRSLLAIAILIAVKSPAQEAGSGYSANQPAVIAASIEFPGTYADPADQLAQLLRKELENVSAGQVQDIEFFKGPADEFKSWAVNHDSRYAASIEITEHAWKVDHQFQLPFVFHVFRNNFNMKGSVKLYRHGNAKPILMKDYKISIGGPRVYQVVIQNPHDGGLSIPYSRRMQLENEAEGKFINKAAKEIFQTMERYGG
jgi:hypothetical protein